MSDNLDKLNVIFFGSFYPKKILETIKDNTYGKVGFSNHNFEMSLIKGLMRHEDVNLKILTSPEVFSYPYNNRLFFTKSERYSINSIPVKSISFINLAVLNKMWKSVSAFISLITLIQSFKNQKVYVIVNTPNLFLEIPLFLCSLVSKKEINKTLIIPDMPDQLLLMNKGNFIKMHILSLLNRCTMKLASSFDNYVLLTDAMKSYLKSNSNYIVMEGIWDVDDKEGINYKFVENYKNSSSPSIILYTGTLRYMFGVMNLLKAFEMGNFTDAELWICGSGEAEKEIEISTKRNPKIKYLGLLDTSKVREVQMRATILVNPRTSMGEYTKYSFPSKTIEYLLTGKAVIMNRLPGIPEEYFNYVFCPKDETVHSLTDTLAEILAMDRKALYKQTRKGREFVLKSKNSVVQTRHILDLIKNSCNNDC